MAARLSYALAHQRNGIDMGSKELASAFDTLEARAEAGVPSKPADRIALRDHIVDIEIGAFQSERGTTQRVSFDVVVEVAPSDAAASDDVDAILSYDTLTEAIAFELAAERLNLLETLAERIADRILLSPQALRVFLRIQKLDRGPGALGVEIVRDRAAAPKNLETVDHLSSAIVLVLAEDHLASDHLHGWVSQIECSKRPAVIMLAPSFAQTPNVGGGAPQRRVDLLAYEQAAWGLAARDKRCIVMDSRTELDHAAKTGLIAVWAPSKMVLDATSPPDGDIRDVGRLARWFTAEIGTGHLVQIGVPAMGSANVQDAGIGAELNLNNSV